MSPGEMKTTSTKRAEWSGGFFYRVARRRVAQFALVIGVAGAMVATLTSTGVATASPSSKGADLHIGGRYGCQFNWGGRHHRNNYRDCTETLTGTVTTLGTNSFTVQRGFSAPPTTASTTTTTTTPVAANCSASTSGETQLNESSFVAGTNTTSSTTDAPQKAITNAVNGNTAAGRFSSDEYQAVNYDYEVNMGSAQTFNEIEMAVPNSPTDHATGYEVNVSSDGTTWATVATCTGSGTPEIASFPTQTAQYLAVVLTAADTSYYWSIDQFFVYNTGAAPTTTTTTTVPVSSGLWTVDVSGGTRYIESCTRSSGFGDIAAGDIVSVSGYRAGAATIDATSVTIKAPSGTSWSSSNCPGRGYRRGHGNDPTTTTTTAVPTTSTTSWGGGSGGGHRHHGR